MAVVAVRGRAEADVPPDRVRLFVAVRAEAAVGAEALALLVPRAAALDAALAGAGDLVLLLRPAALSLTPLWSQNQVTGQVARRSVTVEARATGERVAEALGELLAALVAVPGSTVEGTQWLVDPGNPAHRRLRAAAVRDARDRATDYARAADLALGEPESITEPGVDRSPEPFAQAVPLSFRAAEAGDGGPVLELTPQPVPVGTAVDVRYALLAGPSVP